MNCELIVHWRFWILKYELLIMIDDYECDLWLWIMIYAYDLWFWFMIMIYDYDLWFSAASPIPTMAPI